MAVKHSLVEIVQTVQLQALQDAFASTLHVTIVTVDPDGQRITRPSNWHGFCGVFGKAKKTAGACDANMRALVAECRRTRRIAMRPCPHTGLSMAAFPIELDGTFLGAWVFGQLRMEDLPPAKIAEVATRLDVTPASVQALLDRLPAFTPEHCENIFQCLVAVRQLVANLMRTMDTMRTFIDASYVALYVCDYHTGELLMVNDYYCRHMGLSKEEAVGKPCWSAANAAYQGPCPFCPKKALLDSHGRPNGPYEWTYHDSAQDRWLRSTNQAIDWTDGRLAIMVTLMDVTEEYRTREKLMRIAYYDDSTGLPNGKKLAADLADPGDAATRHLIVLRVTSTHDLTCLYGAETGGTLMDTVAVWLALLGPAVYHTDQTTFCILLEGASTQQRSSPRGPSVSGSTRRGR